MTKYLKVNGTPLDIDEVSNYLKENSGRTVEFTMQSRPIKEAGKVDGLQIDDIIQYCVYYLEKLNSEVYCDKTEKAISELQDALNTLVERTEDRKDRGVEGTSQQ